MEQIMSIERFLSNEGSFNGLFESTKDLKATLTSKCNSALYFVDGHINELERESKNLNSMLEDALLIMKLARYENEEKYEVFNLDLLKNELTARFQNFYPFVKFDLIMDETENVYLNSSLFRKAIDKLINLALKICQKDRPKINISGNSLCIEFANNKFTSDEYHVIKNGLINDSKHGDIEVVSLRIAAVKRLLELAGANFDLDCKGNGQLVGRIQCGNSLSLNRKGVA